MKKYFASLLLLTCLNPLLAQSLSLQSVQNLMSDIEQSTFRYKETGLAFGYFSIQSCLYVSQDIAILKNYCFPKKAYLARGYTIISPKYGMIDIYEEKIDAFYKRDITQVEFSALVAPNLPQSFPVTPLAKWNEIMVNLYNQYNPGCWSTNWSFYTKRPEANCTINTSTIFGFESWSLETQNLTGDEVSWNGLLDTIEKKLNP